MIARRTHFIASLLALSACGRQPAVPDDQEKRPPQLAPLPPLELVELLPRMSAVAAEGPTVPDEARMKQLAELIDLAWLPDATDARTRSMVQRSIGDEAEIDWALEAGLAHADATVRSQCAYQLGERGHVASIPILLVRIRQDEKDGVVVSWMIDALAKLGCLGALDRLGPLLADATSMQAAGTAGLSVLKQVGRELAEGATYVDIAAAIAALHGEWQRSGTVPDAESEPEPTRETLDPLYRQRLARHAFELGERNLRPVDNARFVFSRIGRTSLLFLGDILRAKENYVRRYGLEIADQLGVPAAPLGEPVLALLGDSFTHTLAARVLGSIGVQRALPYLLERLTDADPELRVGAADGLGLLGDPSAFDALRARLHAPDETIDVKVHAAWALALLSPGDRYLLERLRAGDYHESVLRELLDALRQRRR